MRFFKFRLHANLTASLVKVGEYPRSILPAKASINQVANDDLPSGEMGMYIPAGEITGPFFSSLRSGDLNRAIFGIPEYTLMGTGIHLRPIGSPMPLRCWTR